MAARPSPYWRSLLYVPANVERFVRKAASSGADAIVLDLEDSVADEGKASARAALADAVATCGGGGADVLVRVNRPLRQLVADVEAALLAGARGLLLSKIAGAEHVRLVAELCADIRPQHSTWLVPMIETAAAVAEMAEIGRASPGVVAMLTGSEDIAAETASAADGELVCHIKLQMVLAAVQSGIRPLGLLGSVADYRDLDGLRAIALRSRRAGMEGGTCIHPDAVPVLNEAFSPSDCEVDLARRQILAGEQAAAEGRGSCQVDGRMVDAPVLAQARRVLAMSAASGVN